MWNKTLVIAIAAGLLGSGAVFAQEKGPGTGTEPDGPSNGGFIEGQVGGSLPGQTCTGSGGVNCPGAIPDFGGGSLTSTMDVAGCGTAGDVDVGLDVTHTWVGDLEFTVTAPDTTAVTIVDRPGVPASTFGCSGDDIFAVLDDGALAPVENECAGSVPTIDGTFSPNQALAALSGVNADGTWTMTVTDNFVGDTGTLNDWSLQLGCGSERATFEVNKFFDDGNPGEVEVTLSCNTGLPLQQTTTISQGDGVVFVVTDFEDGEMDCEVTETGGVGGYAVSYTNAAGTSDTSCSFEGIVSGEESVCRIDNTLQSVDVDVTKEWIDENPEFLAANVAQADYSCSNEVFTVVSGELSFSGNPDTESFSVFPNWNGSTTCTVTESFLEGGVEADDSDCQSLSVTPGNGASCTIVNTRLFEGIPTLSQYGLTLLALLMLGLGFVAYRRMV